LTKTDLLRLNQVPGAKSGGLLDGELQLPHIARPGMETKQSLRRSFEALALGKEVAGQKDQIVSPISQGGDIQNQAREPVVEVLAKLARSDHVGQVSIRGRDHPDLNTLDLGTSQGANLSLLENPQELGLQGGGQFANFIQKKGTTIGSLEGALPGLIGTGEGSLDVSKKLTPSVLAVAKQGAVHDHERTLGRRAIVVDSTGQPFFPGSRFSLQEDREIQRAHSSHQPEEFSHGFAGPQDTVKERLLVERGREGGLVNAQRELTSTKLNEKPRLQVGSLHPNPVDPSASLGSQVSDTPPGTIGFEASMLPGHGAVLQAKSD
jgi:hypothetical protein